MAGGPMAPGACSGKSRYRFARWERAPIDDSGACPDSEGTGQAL